MRTVTLQDVARLAGVSTATASRVLSGHPATSVDARTRVAEARCDRVVALENDQDEKRMFDRMASLIAAGTKETRHD